MATPSGLLPGTVFARDYRVVRPLAEGGMGAVYVVEQLSTAKLRALKIMHPQCVQDPRQRARFAQEARVGASIESDHVVDVVGAGVDDASGMPWLAMELLKGEDLASVIEKRGALTVPEVLEIFRQLCHALSAAHRGGLVHRDMKPENIFLAAPRREGVPFTVKILDFGIAKIVQEATTNQTQALGSPLWMAPEQTEQGGAIRPATDVWALGQIAFRLLTGKSYWRGANVEGTTLMTLLREIVMEPLESASARAASLGAPGALPYGFDAWFARCVDRDIGRRFNDAAEAMAALQPLLGGGATLPAAAANATDMEHNGRALNLSALALPAGLIAGGVALVAIGALVASSMRRVERRADGSPSGLVDTLVVRGTGAGARGASQGQPQTSATAPGAVVPAITDSRPVEGPTGNGPAADAGTHRASVRVRDVGHPRAAQRTPTVRVQIPAVTGSGVGDPVMVRSNVRRIALINLPRVRSCYERSLIDHPGLEGTVTVRYVIGSSGSVTNSNAIVNTLSDADLGMCIASEVRRWVFPVQESGGIVIVTQPFGLVLLRPSTGGSFAGGLTAP